MYILTRREGDKKMSITKKKYGQTPEMEAVTIYTLTNKNGMSATFIDYGAILVNLFVPDAKEKMEDVVLGYDNLEGYLTNAPGFGSFIGRHANRIGDAKFEINGTTYELEKNEGNNNLHGGSKGYNKVVYETEYFEEEDSCVIEFSRLSTDMEQGFPGNLDVTVSYTLTDDNELVIEYLAVSDKDTLVNLTNHTYFNLTGHKYGTVLEHKMMIAADQFTPTADDLIPTGEIVNVEGTPMDFRTLKVIGAENEADYKPLKQAGGYDHNFVLKTTKGEIEKVAELVDEKSGRTMEVFTDLPGLQVYTANFLSEDKNGKEGMVYHKNAGVCFETQFFPNSCNHKEFKSCLLKAEEEFDYATIYKFGVL